MDYSASVSPRGKGRLHVCYTQFLNNFLRENVKLCIFTEMSLTLAYDTYVALLQWHAFPCVHCFVCCLENFLYLFSSSLELSPWWRADAWNVCFETLYGGKFTIPTQLIILNCPVILSQRRDSAVSLENYPLYSWVYFSSDLWPMCVARWR